MHISLDSALGRQRRLNSVGESVLQIAPSATAAYSLRSLTGGDPKVVRVRRSSDNSEQDFTAAGISSGALVNFVNEIQTLGTVTNSVGNDGFTLTNKSSTGFTATTDTATGVCGWPYTAKAGDKITVSFDAVVRAGTPQFIPRKATALSGSNLVDVVSDSAISVNSTASYSFEFTYDSDDAGSLTFSEGDDNADFDISNFQVTSFKGAGLVETWYDQSGNNNHATQATAANQPKIVDAGSLLTAGVTFDGGDSLSVSGEPVITASSSGVYSTFSVQTIATSEEGYLYGNASTSNGSSLYATTSTFAATNKTSTLDNISRSSGQNLLSAVYNNGDAGLLVNGAGTMTDTGTYNFSAGTSDFIIGNRNGGSASATFLTGSINEIIVYNSDELSNRTALETNINSHYSIF